jgi:hypothetical protein
MTNEEFKLNTALLALGATVIHKVGRFDTALRDPKFTELIMPGLLGAVARAIADPDEALNILTGTAVAIYMLGYDAALRASTPLPLPWVCSDDES